MELADLNSASDQLDGLIERRATQREKASWEADRWRRSEERQRERIRRERIAGWYGFHAHMQELHAQLAAEHEAKALALLEGRC